MRKGLHSVTVPSLEWASVLIKLREYASECSGGNHSLQKYFPNWAGKTPQNSDSFKTTWQGLARILRIRTLWTPIFNGSLLQVHGDTLYHVKEGNMISWFNTDWLKWETVGELSSQCSYRSTETWLEERSFSSVACSTAQHTTAHPSWEARLWTALIPLQ